MSLKFRRFDGLFRIKLSLTGTAVWVFVLVLGSVFLLPTAKAADAAASTTTTAATATTAAAAAAAATTTTNPINDVDPDAPSSAKRGLIVVQDISSTDLQKFLDPPSDLTWYYNYSPNPTSFLHDNAPHLQFVPQLWGNYNGADKFLATVKSQMSSGSNISTVLAFNEPDSCDNGGSCVTPSDAASLWQSQLAPLQQAPYKLQVGSPAVTGGPGGFTWLAEFFAACDGACRPDFIAIHWYGNFEGLASHIGQVNATFLNNVTNGLWVTEFADNNVSLPDAQSFYNMSTQYMDRLPYIHRYAYFGAFRSSVSNIGPDAAMLTQSGLLTDIGSWYLGGKATGNIPLASSAVSFRPSLISGPFSIFIIMVPLVVMALFLSFL